jgi:arginyl-tRNA synthetase
MLELIRKKIEKAVKAAGYDLPASFNLEEPPNSKMGDYATNIALTIASHQKKNLREVAEDIRQQLLRDSDIKSIEVAGPGFINFSLDPQFHFEYAQNMVSAKLPDIGQGKKVVLEHTNVNPNKALHIGHLRNACLGNSCQKILTALGHNVEAQYYVDDTGVQVAVTLLGMLGLQPVNSENKKYDHFAQDVYVQTMERLETDDLLKCKQAEIIESLDQQKGELAIEAKEMATKVIYSNLETMCNMNVDYDLLVWESDILKNGFWEKAFSILREKNLKSFVLEKSGKNAGCWVIKGVLGEDKVIVKSNGVVTYTGKDVAYHLWKFNLLGKDFLYKEWPHRLQKKSLFTTAQNGERSDKFGRGDIVVNFIDVRQTLPQLAVKESLRLLGYEKQAENFRE